MKPLKAFFLTAMIASQLSIANNAMAQTVTTKAGSLNAKQQSLIVVSALAGKGDLQPLHTALNEALSAGWTINELKEAMVHLYAYAGFPRSLNGLSTLKTVVEERKAKGLKDEAGREPSLLPGDKTKLEAGTALQAKLLGSNMKTSVADFAPIIDVFLKEHLFWDIFGRDNLNFQIRELITISTLAGLGGAEAQLRAHIGVSMYNGITEAQLKDWVSILQTKVGNKEGEAADNALQAVLKQKQIGTSANEMNYNKAKGSEQKKSSLLIRISEIEIYRDSLDAYKAILKEEAEASVRLEPGVISIFPMYQQKDSTQVRILEIYANREAYELHLKTPHFLHYKTTTLKMVKSLQLIDMNAIDPATMTKIFTKLKDERGD